MISLSILLLVPLAIWPIMSLFPFLQTFITRALGLDDRAGSSPQRTVSQPGSDASDDPSHVHEPSAMDVVVTKMMLQQGLRLPPEVVLSVLDFAEYWPHSTAVMDRSLTVTSGGESENAFIVSLRIRIKRLLHPLPLSVLTVSQVRSRPLGLIKTTHYDDHIHSITPVSPTPLPDDAEYSLSQFQDWIGSPTNTVQHPCRKIVFTITSHDQGWSNNARQDRGSYRGSWTWFEAGLERFEKDAKRPEDSIERAPVAAHDQVAKEAEPRQSSTDTTATAGAKQLPKPYLPVYSLRPIYPTLEPDRPALHHDLHPSHHLTIQRNKTAVRDSQTHKVVWSWTDNASPLTAEQLSERGRGEQTGNGDFVRNLKLGDTVTVWAKSRFGAWANHVESVRIDVYWAL